VYLSGEVDPARVFLGKTTGLVVLYPELSSSTRLESTRRRASRDSRPSTPGGMPKRNLLVSKIHTPREA
jgi:hypothetical protein